MARTQSTSGNPQMRKTAAFHSTRALGAETVRVGPLMGIPALLRDFDCDPEAIFHKAGFQLAQFEDPDTQVSYLSAGRLLALCVAASGCRQFGLTLGTNVSPSSLGIAGFLLQTAPDVGKALDDLVNYFALHDQGGETSLRVQGDMALLGYDIHLYKTEAKEQAYDLSIAIACGIMRNLCGARWSPIKVLLSHPAPSDPTPYKNFFRAPIRFNAHQNAVQFSSHWLTHPLSKADPLLHQHLAQEAEILRAQQGDEDLLRKLHRALRQLMGMQRCTAADAAKKLHIHERTLNRRLQAQGASFRQEFDKVRYDIAKQLLTDGRMPLIKIVSALQYSDTTAFSRAFKRWSGVTPTQWRERGAADALNDQ